MIVRYLATLSTARLILWCYLIWYLCIVFLHWDPSPLLWATSLGMSANIGLALLLSTSGNGRRPDGWTIFRLFLMPFCVSSYSALIKGKGFLLIFPPELRENAVAFGVIALFLVLQAFVGRPREIS